LAPESGTSGATGLRNGPQFESFVAEATSATRLQRLYRRSGTIQRKADLKHSMASTKKRSSPTRKGSSSRKTSAKGRSKVSKVMHEYKRGSLKSGGKTTVKSRKQAVAIGLSEARRSGAKVPRKKTASRKGR